MKSKNTKTYAKLVNKCCSLRDNIASGKEEIKSIRIEIEKAIHSINNIVKNNIVYGLDDETMDEIKKWYETHENELKYNLHRIECYIQKCAEELAIKSEKLRTDYNDELDTLTPIHTYSLVRCEEARDKYEMCEWISKQFNDPFDEVMGYLNELSINWGMSVKALDENGNTIGFLTLSDYRIEEETEKIKEDNPTILNALNKLNYISFFSFIVAPQYRGTKLNYDMVMSLEEDLKKYDFIFVPVQHQLNTHDYWKRWGGIKFYEDDESKFYAIPKSYKGEIIINALT